MGDLLIRNVPKKTLDGLKAAAKRHKRSVQAEVLELLEQANTKSGDALIQWLKENPPEPGVSSSVGIAAIREDRDTR